MLNNSSTFIFIILLSLTSSNIVLIPFKILNKNSINSLTNTSDPFTYIKNEIDKTLYSELYIGDPPRKMTVIITFNSGNTLCTSFIDSRRDPFYRKRQEFESSFSWRFLFAERRWIKATRLYQFIRILHPES